MDDCSPDTVFICNTSLHVMNAMDACVHFGVDPKRAWLVIKSVPTDTPDSIRPVIALGQWARTIWVGDVPAEGRGILSFWRFQLDKYRFYRKWQSELADARGVLRVFISFNRMAANQIIANWLGAREVVWLDDGTLSYALALDSVLPPVKARKAKAVATVKEKAVVKSSVSAKKVVSKNLHSATAKRQGRG